MLAATDLTTAYDGFRLGPLDLTVDDEVLAVLGPSGCGKTTLLSLLAGIVSPDGGSVSLAGRSLDGLPPERRGMGLVFQDGALFPHMTARENVAYAADSPERVASLASRLEIADVLDRSAATLSGGERQRVALARALAADPDALLLDEPLTNLDAPIRRRLRDELHDLFASLSIPILYVTHDQRAATALGDRLAVLRDGRIEQVGAPRAVLDRPATEFVASFTGSENLLDAEVVGADGDSLTLAVGDATLRARGEAAVGARVTACVRPARIRVGGREDAAESQRVADGAGDAEGENVLAGTVRRSIHEGDEYRLTVDVAAVADPVLATVPAVEVGGEVAEGATVRVAIPPDAVHVIDSE